MASKAERARAVQQYYLLFAELVKTTTDVFNLHQISFACNSYGEHKGAVVGVCGWSAIGSLVCNSVCVCGKRREEKGVFFSLLLFSLFSLSLSLVCLALFTHIYIYLCVCLPLSPSLSLSLSLLSQHSATT